MLRNQINNDEGAKVETSSIMSGTTPHIKGNRTDDIRIERWSDIVNDVAGKFKKRSLMQIS